MKSKLIPVLAATAIFLFVSTPAFAEAGGAAGGSDGLMGVGAGLAVGLAAGGAALGQGRTGAAAMEGVARNPQTAGKLQTMMIIALALMEALGIYGLLIGLKLSGVF